MYKSKPSVNELVDKAIGVFKNSNKPRVVIIVVGIPGSGKTTLAQVVADQVNARGIKACALGMDGFHLTRAQLDQMPDPKAAHLYRGAPFTFDAHGVVQLVQSLHDTSVDLSVPTFDHKLKDPVEGGIVVGQEVQIVFLEGLYLLLDTDPWNKIGNYADDQWLVVVDETTARERLAQRHFQSGICSSPELGYERAAINDIPNGKLVLKALQGRNVFTIRTDNSPL